ncbi:matrixin family metalloprotease [Hymenobacter sp. B81]|uniref:matrixin family metalloprotease n=1 Tax=Hymenobacter sp. B81 TaxID=3344878 RepID=UPI0037DC0254
MLSCVTFRALRLLFAGLLTSAVAAAQAPAAEATRCLLRPLDPAARAQRATLVVEGEVLEQRSFWDAPRRRIYTAHTVRVFRLLKGTLPAGARELTVLTEGGQVGNELQVLTNTLALRRGEQGLLFLTPSRLSGTAAGAWEVYASQQGFVRYDLVELSAAEPFRRYPQIDAELYRQLLPGLSQPARVLAPNPALLAAQARHAEAGRDVNAALITSLSPLTLRAGTGEVLTISGLGFGAAPGQVAFRNADDGGNSYTPALRADILAWSDTQIRVRVPSFTVTTALRNGQEVVINPPAGSGPVRVLTAAQEVATSAVPVTILSAQTNIRETGTLQVVPTDHFNQNGRGGYSFRYSPDFAQNTGARQAFERALAQWRCHTGINWEVGPVRPGRGTGVDDVNSVEFSQSGELPANVLGRATTNYLGCFNPAGEVVFRVREIDMQFAPDVDWQFGPAPAAAQQYDFESVTVHELGHAQQLSHVIRPGAVLHYAIGRGQTQRQLDPASDVAGGRTVLLTRSLVPDACGPGPMLPAPLNGQLLARVDAGGVALSWETRDECNVQAFVVERSADARSWQTLASVRAAAPGGQAGYGSNDAQPLPGLSYYRLLVELTDGTRLPAAPVAVRAGAAAVDFAVYPNPVAGREVQLEYQAPATGDLIVRVYDALGRYHGGQRLAVQQTGLSLLTFSLPAGLKAGWYALRWEAAGRGGTVPLLKVE